ncbi:TetR/AcrR family transcriptional regulator [Gordonia rubripertincta]|uniref:TetR/AcrR family transcriptional regulator n=1 Tax=Gordonia rubripertincta TaxID=36822 RepID=A0ABT4MY74_GORRU|nr:TetR/AcrR family transcriptional regulator [Gordonia rubripertincta]MCZ4551952.1 TetR/AcrR family transcriptional regulator [Gordonia rubripertincta]
MTSRTPSWLGSNRSAMAANRILDVAADLFIAHGVAPVNMNQIAAAAGCSRATLYRYFASRGDLYMAFVEREARALSKTIADRVAEISDPHEQVTEAILAAVDGVRTDPVLRTWFLPESAALTGAIGTSSELVNRIAVAFVNGGAYDSGAESNLQGRFMVRVILSLLMTPGADATEERELVRRFVTPSVLGSN